MRRRKMRNSSKDGVERQEEEGVMCEERTIRRGTGDYKGGGMTLK
jgi:hypothetical protein